MNEGGESIIKETIITTWFLNVLDLWIPEEYFFFIIIQVE